MEENGTSWPLNSVPATTSFLLEIMSVSSKTNADPLLSCVITLYTLILLYFPQALKHSLSPVLILTALLLLFLLRFGALQKALPPPETHAQAATDGRVVSQVDDVGFDPKPTRDFETSFVEWNVKAPLEIIYEAYEGEEEEEEDGNGINELYQKQLHHHQGLDRYPSLSMYYPETDSDSSSDGDFPTDALWDSPERFCFQWEEEDREGSLIEIALDHNNKDSGLGLDLDPGFHVDEDNLIEIDISVKNDNA